MRIVTPPLIVEENDGFINDILERKAYGEALLNLVVNSSDDLVVSLDGKWGEGKTTFIKMWQGLLLEDNIPNIYIDAFENDYIDDAFISVVSSITRYAETNISDENQDKIIELKEKSKMVGGQLLSWTAKVGLKAATLGVIKDSEIEELMDIKGDLAKGVSDLAGGFIEERINSHTNDIELIQSFKELLSKLPERLQSGEGKPLIIIIDELDRCKPSYAVEVVEKIKHLFSVKNIVFILVMNKLQLEESIKSVYGKNIDAHTYLQKFIHLEMKLPKRTGRRHENDITSYSRKLFELHEIEAWGEGQYIIDSIDALANHLNLSLRQLEKVYTNIALFYGSSSKNQFRLAPIVSFLSVVKVINSELFEELLYQTIIYPNVEKAFNYNVTTNNSDLMYKIMNWVRFGLMNDEEYRELSEEDEIKRYNSALFQYNIDREEIIPFLAKKINMFITG